MFNLRMFWNKSSQLIKGHENHHCLDGKLSFLGRDANTVFNKWHIYNGFQIPTMSSYSRKESRSRAEYGGGNDEEKVGDSQNNRMRPWKIVF